MTVNTRQNTLNTPKTILALSSVNPDDNLECTLSLTVGVYNECTLLLLLACKLP